MEQGRCGLCGTQHGVKGVASFSLLPTGFDILSFQTVAPLSDREVDLIIDVEGSQKRGVDREVHQGRVRGLRTDGLDVALPPAGVWQDEGSASETTARPPLLSSSSLFLLPPLLLSLDPLLLFFLIELGAVQEEGEWCQRGELTRWRPLHPRRAVQEALHLQPLGSRRLFP